MELVCHDSGDTRIIEVAESRIDAAVAIQFKDRMRAFSDDGPMRVILDLSRVTFLDSSGLGAVVAVLKQMGGGRRLELAGLTPKVAKVFRLTRMDTVFTIHPDLATFEAGLGNAR